MTWDEFLADKLTGVKSDAKETRVDGFIKIVTVSASAIAMGLLAHPQRIADIVKGTADNLGASQRPEVLAFLDGFQADFSASVRPSG